MTPSNVSTLNARQRKLPKNPQGNIIARDVARQQQKDVKEMHDFFATLNMFYKKVQSDPSVWSKEQLQPTRDFCKFILQNQNRYPFDCDVLIESLVPSANQKYDIQQVQSTLTSGFVQSITDKSWSYEDGVDEPVVQILHTDKGEYQTYSRRFDSVKIFCLTVLDGDGNRLLARVGPNLTETAMHLLPGHLVRLRIFNDMLMKSHPSSPPTSVIVIV
jgi:hypothetical protein